MNRPTASDPDVIEAAVQRILPAVVQWCRDGNDNSAESEIAADLKAEIPWADDGYEFCKRLERDHMWECDRELVGILDEANLSGALREMEKKWVAAYRVFPGKNVGDAVRWESHPAEITEVHPDGKYTVCIPALGHVRSGIGTHGRIVEWERIDGKINMLGLTVTGPLFQALA